MATPLTPTARGGGARTWAAWGLGALLAGWIVSAISDLTVEWPPPMAWDDALGRPTLAPGTTWIHAREGFGISRVGAHGVLGIPVDFDPATPSLLIWGDSHVEGAEVHDAQRLPQQVTRFLADGPRPLVALGIAAAGRNVADTHALLPSTERVFTGARAHALVVAGPGDLLPDSPEAQHGRFVSHPELALVPEAPPPRAAIHARRGQILRHLHLVAPVRALRRARDGQVWTSWRFRLGPVAPAAVEDRLDQRTEATAELDHALRFLMRELRGRTSLPIAIVLVPRDTPALGSAGLTFRAEETALERLLRARCEEAGVALLDLRESFNQFAAETGRLPLGFANGRPGRGHWNADGHRLIAEAVARWAAELSPADGEGP